MGFLLQTVLSPYYYVTAVQDVFQGLAELAKRDKMDLVLIDCDHHSGQAADFIQHISTSGLYKATPIVVLTSNGQWENEHPGITGVVHVFNKPFSPKDMVDKINELMRWPSVQVLEAKHS